jgi:hypothetical protein
MRECGLQPCTTPGGYAAFRTLGGSVFDCSVRAWAPAR